MHDLKRQLTIVMMSVTGDVLERWNSVRMIVGIKSLLASEYSIWDVARSVFFENEKVSSPWLSPASVSAAVGSRGC